MNSSFQSKSQEGSF